MLPRMSRSDLLNVVKTLPHGSSIECVVNGTHITNAKVSWDHPGDFSSDIYIVHNTSSCDGGGAENRLGFKYSWWIGDINDGIDDELESLQAKGGSSPSAGPGPAMNELDKLIIDDESRAEIEAVLKQHKFGNKIFEEWGLGDVIEYGKGMTMLFWGPPGTGKTWGANCIAKALNKQLLVVSSAEIQSSEPGGAERAIIQAFASARSNGSVLFFDECDSLITDRTNVGMILGSEINTLLTQIEKFEGVCILCTNRVDTLDEALERRISLIQEFPNPDREQREQIWARMLPKKMPVGEGVTPKALARSVLTGGQIKNVVLGAARRAVSDNYDKVTLDHFETAIDKIKASKGLMGKTHPGFRAKMQSEPTMGPGGKTLVKTITDVEKTVTDVEKVESTDKVPVVEPIKTPAKNESTT